jgi:hypothetical protein
MVVDNHQFKLEVGRYQCHNIGHNVVVRLPIAGSDISVEHVAYIEFAEVVSHLIIKLQR